MDIQETEIDRRTRQREADKRYLSNPEKLEKKRERDREYKSRLREQRYLAKAVMDPLALLATEEEQARMLEGLANDVLNNDGAILKKAAEVMEIYDPDVDEDGVFAYDDDEPMAVEAQKLDDDGINAFDYLND
jgi:uncharacterized membrane protein YgaE (UPF0421/DUF939 family)